MKDTVLLEELSWPEVQEALDAGVRTVVIVAASVEQHGPHLPTMTDAAIGQAVGERVARKSGRIRPRRARRGIGAPQTLRGVKAGHRDARHPGAPFYTA
ncbi:MAG TPA: creatininase family protein [bacterium]|nr:creatininase family protein [bacterium]